MKLTDYENPMTGKKESIFDVSSLFAKILGIVVMLFVVATGQNLAKQISGKTKLDTSIDPIINVPTTPTNVKRVY